MSASAASSPEHFLTSLFSLGGRTVLVTGASSGLGAHFARTCARAGASHVVLAARRKNKLEELQRQIQASSGSGVKVSVVVLDVSDAAAIPKAFDAIEQQNDGKCVDVLINNAGVGYMKPFTRLTAQDYDQTMTINTRGVFLVAVEAAKRMVSQGVAGNIINISSIMGGRVAKLFSVYCTSKAAVVQATKSMALELASKGICVNAILPGYYRSEMTQAFLDTQQGQQFVKRGVPIKRQGELHELDGALLLLASKASSNMHGAILAVDGGHLVSSL